MKFRIAALALLVVSASWAVAADWPLTTKIAETHKVLGTDTWYGCRRTVFDFDGVRLEEIFE